jgi:chemotaxis protein MotB
MSETVQPIIVIKKKGGHGGHHGGAWKVAYADFVTAMMSLFIVLWLMNSTPQVKKAIAGYFNDPRGTSRQMGTDILGSGPSVVIDKTSVEKLQEQIRKAIVQQKELDKLKDQVELKMTNEGLRIELIEGKNGTFYQSGSPKLSPAGEELLGLLAKQLAPLPNHLQIEGHTDAKPMGNATATYSNWELSSDRANAARRILQQDGVGPHQINQVRGYADEMLRVPNDPLDPSNRRISLLVQFLEAPAGTKGPETLDMEGGKKPEGKEGEGAEKGAEKGKEAAPTPAPAEKPKPVDVAPTAGKIELPAIPTGKPGDKSSSASGAKPSPASPTKLGDQLNQLREMKKADAPKPK